jgi:hypothetical protein
MERDVATKKEKKMEIKESQYEGSEKKTS